MYNPAEHEEPASTRRLNSPANRAHALGLGLPPLYAAKTGGGGVVLHEDEHSQTVKSYYPAHFKDKPRKGSKYTFVNCVRRSLIWI